MSVFKHVGSFKRVPFTYLGALAHGQKKINLHPVSKITFKFDPFNSTKNRDFRELMFVFSAPKVRDTNLYCRIKTDIVCDQSEPEINCELTNGTKLKFKAGNLDAFDIVRELNCILKPLQLPPPPPEPTSKVVKLKSKRRKRQPVNANIQHFP
jgi:hypothetical protein